jgi:hypothetical protein
MQHETFTFSFLRGFIEMKLDTISAKSAYDSVRGSVDSIKNGEHAIIPAMEPGDTLRQGDIYIVAIDVSIDGKPHGSRQLAPGTTQGSRHIVEGDCDVIDINVDEGINILARLIPATRGVAHFFGPAIIARSQVTITHPEHGDRSISAGNYLTIIQRTWADEVRRTAD